MGSSDLTQGNIVLGKALQKRHFMDQCHFRGRKSSDDQGSFKRKVPGSSLNDDMIFLMTVATPMDVQLIPPKSLVAFTLVMISIGTDDLSHSCVHVSHSSQMHM